MSRPLLPWRHQNAKLKDLDSKDLPPVKYQLLDRDGQEVLVGRMKIPTPTGHAFILRRFDTGAISLTTMYRAAFPGAKEEDERKETAWVKENHELLGNNGSTKEPKIIRLAGTWVDPVLALEIAETYALSDIIALIAKAVPDPKAVYRRSSKASPKIKESNTPKPLSTSSTSMTAPSAAKRRKESPAPSATSTVVSPAPRRSARMKSAQPEPAPAPLSTVTSPKSAKKTRRGAASALTNGDESILEEDEEIVAMAGPDMSQDIAEQKELIKSLKAGMNGTEEEAKSKRAREEESEALKFQFKDPEVGERAIATNRRVGFFHMEPRTKSVAWGLAAFAVGVGAVTFLPSLL
jgi:hypothetical protein